MFFIFILLFGSTWDNLDSDILPGPTQIVTNLTKVNTFNFAPVPAQSEFNSMSILRQ